MKTPEKWLKIKKIVAIKARIDTQNANLNLRHLSINAKSWCLKCILYPFV